ncbi:hypothetical protein B0T16DRAFT_429699 [Cercophora newfieldiana]|uniref:N-acetyltransferase domain-containing protein n=1 Tax=Cercophora newfieldiana TaxID=92897 RepID=A0AA40CS49_9PEZI|nr:hypothetical protein B0T16DRAFT_429699 [Cercophora newfieldiana]
MASPPTFRIRDAVPSPSNTDALFIGAAFDSCIPHLATVGSASQWGSQPITSRPKFLESRIKSIADASEYLRTRSGDPVRVLIIEAELASGEYLPVGSMTLRGNYFSQYLLEQEHLDGVTKGQSGDWMFLETLVTSFEEATKPYRKGAGAALARWAKEWAEELGLGVMFYESQGFVKVAPFEATKEGEAPWPGMFLRMDLGKKE